MLGKVKLLWQRNGKCYSKELERSRIKMLFESLIVTFPTRNEISRKIVAVIDKAECFYINWDSTADVNSIYYFTEEKEKLGIPVIIHHKIVWEIWDGLCINGKEEPIREYMI